MVILGLRFQYMRHPLRIGDYVQSHFRARWYGVVTKVDGASITVHVTHESTGHPQRKHFIKQLHMHWLTKYDAPAEWKEFADGLKHFVESCNEI